MPEDPQLRVIVTGASSGIGLAIAQHFLALGHCVALVARWSGTSGDPLAEVLPPALHRHAAVVRADLCRQSSDHLKAVVAQCVGLLGGLDVLVNNAGRGVLGQSVEALRDLDLQDTLDLNFRAVALLTAHAIPHLKAARTRCGVSPSIINVSSFAAHRPIRNLSAYCASKAAVDALTQCTALELGEAGIRCNSVRPATVVTNFHSRAGMGDEKAETFYRDSAQVHPIGRVGSGDDVAALVVFLAGNQASWVTGSCIDVDGGRQLTSSTHQLLQVAKL